ncbi:MAG: hypothetical protein WAM14_08085, partial [Candidatus Nitrosopolaris sp.]
SITGPYLAVLGASATVVGIAGGLGELIGYGIRIVSGSLADRRGKYWTITIFGYALDLLVVPLLALANHWEIASFLIIAEFWKRLFDIREEGSRIRRNNNNYARRYRFSRKAYNSQIY